jgi:hypothetical protein
MSSNCAHGWNSQRCDVGAVAWGVRLGLVKSDEPAGPASLGCLLYKSQCFASGGGDDRHSAAADPLWHQLISGSPRNLSL